MKEVEIKALLNDSMYKYLKGLLPGRYQKVNEDNITTIKFRPHDLRIRYSEKFREMVFKSDPDPAAETREEISIPLQDMDQVDKMLAIFDRIGLSQHPSWTTERADFVAEFAGHQYTLSLQNIPNFAKILEAEIITDEPEKHIPNLKKLIKSLGCEPIEPNEFREKVQEYRVKYK
ncbi:hypothetical protein KY362_04890 [Candidatus Woesearchaeota archaeon]|nr:hypothetical protein [Candidatus Woesearchaeota archaeon]